VTFKLNSLHKITGKTATMQVFFPVNVKCEVRRLELCIQMHSDLHGWAGDG